MYINARSLISLPLLMQFPNETLWIENLIQVHKCHIDGFLCNQIFLLQLSHDTDGIYGAMTWHISKLHVSDIDLLANETACHVLKHLHNLVKQLEASIVTTQESSTFSFVKTDYITSPHTHVRRYTPIVHNWGNEMANKNGSSLTGGLQQLTLSKRSQLPCHFSCCQ